MRSRIPLGSTKHKYITRQIKACFFVFGEAHKGANPDSVRADGMKWRSTASESTAKSPRRVSLSAIK
ncbi:hypothetical protein SAMN05216378_3335 [Paenibacillus catalpae]|uniref:Uncharacterized protein n=1 Tax=Paenibacillus catalpae TaxID=1045775 RepID=A0A1I2B1B6_9BACL|nr:hypothetical protein SAMN05216378_3335 [Paenibacillus catalpae]